MPTWRARDVTREIDLVEEVARVHGLERVPFTLPLRQRDVRPAVEAAAPAPARRGRARRRGFFEAYTWSLVGERPRSGRAPAAGAALRRSTRSCGRPCSTGSSRPRATTSTRATRASRCSRSPASTCRAGSSCRTSAGASAAIVEGGYFAGQGRRRDAVRARSTSSRVRARRAARSSTRARPPRSRRAGSASSIRRSSRARGAPSSSTSRRSSPGARAGRLRGRDHVPGRAPGPRVRRRRGRAAGELVEAAREAAGPELREAASSTSTAAARSPRAGSRSRSASPSSRPSARCRTRTPARSASASSPR